MIVVYRSLYFLTVKVWESENSVHPETAFPKLKLMTQNNGHWSSKLSLFQCFQMDTIDVQKNNFIRTRAITKVLPYVKYFIIGTDLRLLFFVNGLTIFS
ncbi:MAG: hypothetical protein DRQ49_14170 [Gammaproteobacteria bacterium]|nr:MAG: hypothetical protein DRQ41_13770 [Gammaproteobacteria bacterium]RKZ38489.1 MAG: hypothetical protein DRQ49_14170 [Gammaproteobacteria bacterium]RKZ77433.1 MAG: hypothetical protein DRQ57_00300 [Gammaproteobacteria bacterium]